MFQASISQPDSKHGGAGVATKARAMRHNLVAPQLQPMGYGNQARLQLSASSTAGSGVLHRKCSCGGQASECPECKKKEEQTIQRREVSGTSGSGKIPQVVHEVLRSSGQPLDRASRAFFEPRFSHHFGDVRIHTDARAAESARAVDAQAYAVGNQVVFGQGKFDPAGHEGRNLLAHELAHVVQQGSSGRNAAPTRISNPNDSSEREAEAAARASLSGPAKATGPACQAAPASTSEIVYGPTLFRLGANADCSHDEADRIHQGIYDSRSWLHKAIPQLEESPLSAKTLGSLRRNFGPTFGVAANAKLIHDRLGVALTAVGTIPYSCARGPADATCANGFCGYSIAGSHRSTICADNTLRADTDAVYRAGCVLHESFHASFSNMGVDFYSGWHGHSSSTATYPGTGTDPLLNADSYTSLAIDLS